MGGDDPSFFSSAPMQTPGGEGEEHFVPSKMGYLHIKNQVQEKLQLRFRNEHLQCLRILERYHGSGWNRLAALQWPACEQLIAYNGFIAWVTQNTVIGKGRFGVISSYKYELRGPMPWSVFRMLRLLPVPPFCSQCASRN